jgi:hypothetical protein
MILILHDNPKNNAELYSDKWLEEMISACADVLRFVRLCAIYDPFESGEREWFRVTAIIGDISITREHALYDWQKWARSCRANYTRLLEYARACCDEWIFRNNPEATYLIGDFDDLEKPDEIVIMQGLTIKKHKHHDVIAWLSDNQPDLPNCADKEQRCTPDCTGPNCYWDKNAQPFPLVMPDKFKQAPYPDHQEAVIASYKGYYAHLLQKAARKKCKTCVGSGEVHGYVEGGDQIVDDCISCKATGYITTAPVWSRRDKPEWLGDL